MGKKSKRRGGGGGGAKNNAQRLLELQQRRERQLMSTESDYDSQDDENDDGKHQYALNSLEFFVGDRVWYRDQEFDTIEDPCYNRGVVIKRQQRTRL